MGLVDKANTHPHRINDRVAIAHNGILSGYGTGKHVSDTGLFVKLVLSQLPKNWWDNTGIQRLLEDAIGVSNKMVLMTNTGRVQIYNEPAGEWEDGAWYSKSIAITVRKKESYLPAIISISTMLTIVV
jgi:predicted glutamine amidotransferase